MSEQKQFKVGDKVRCLGVDFFTKEECYKKGAISEVTKLMATSGIFLNGRDFWTYSKYFELAQKKNVFSRLAGVAGRIFKLVSMKGTEDMETTKKKSWRGKAWSLLRGSVICGLVMTHQWAKPLANKVYGLVPTISETVQLDTWDTNSIVLTDGRKFLDMGKQYVDADHNPLDESFASQVRSYIENVNKDKSKAEFLNKPKTSHMTFHW